MTTNDKLTARDTRVIGGKLFIEQLPDADGTVYYRSTDGKRVTADVIAEYDTRMSTPGSDNVDDVIVSEVVATDVNVTSCNVGIRKGQFLKGNTHGKGRPHGSRNRASVLAQMILDEQVVQITKRVLQMADDGDSTAMKLVVERLVAPRRDNPVDFDIGPINSLTDATVAMQRILAAQSTGELTPLQAESLAKNLQTYANMSSLSEIEQRLAALEQRE